MIQRLSLKEVEEVARLAVQRRFVVYGTGPTVDRVADALGLPPADVERLLIEIRDREAGLLPPDRSQLYRRVAIGAAVAGALALALFLFNSFAGIQGSSSVSAGRDAQPVAKVPLPTTPRFGSGLAPAPVASAQPVGVAEGQFDSGLSSGTLPPNRSEYKNEDTFLDRSRRRFERRSDSPTNRLRMNLSAR